MTRWKGFKMGTPYETYRSSKPLEEKVRLPLVADSSVETGIEIDTGLAPGMEFGWQIVGMDWQIQTVASPHGMVSVGNNAGWIAYCQLCRGEIPDTPVRLEAGDPLVIYEDIWEHLFSTAVGYTDMYWPRKIRKPEVTQKETLYLQFSTMADWAAVSAATNEIYATIYYYLVEAPYIHAHEE